MTCTFDDLAGFSVVVKNPSFGNVRSRRLSQVRGISQGNSRYVYDRGVAEQTFTLQFEELTYDDASKIELFFLVKTMKLFWTLRLTNWMPTHVFGLVGLNPGAEFSWNNVRFDQPFLDFEEGYNGRFNVSVLLHRQGF